MNEPAMKETLSNKALTAEELKLAELIVSSLNLETQAAAIDQLVGARGERHPRCDYLPSSDCGGFFTAENPRRVIRTLGVRTIRRVFAFCRARREPAEHNRPSGG